MRERIIHFKDQYENFVKTYETLIPENKSQNIQKAKILLQQIVEAGNYAGEPEIREELSKMARDLGEKIFEMTNREDYPRVRLMPLRQDLENEVKFVNRLKEREYLTNIYSPPYLLISAPKGFGKTRLLRYFQAILEGWFCIYIELSEKISLKEIVNNILEQIQGNKQVQEMTLTSSMYGVEVGKQILKKLSEKRQSKVVLLIDGAEVIDLVTIKEFLDTFIVKLQNTLQGFDNSIKFRLVVAGRYISVWKQSDIKLHLEVTSLPLLEFDAVSEMTESCFERSELNPNPFYRKSFAPYLMFFTGGHPESLVQILHKDLGNPLDMFISNEEKYYNDLIKPVITEISEHITPPELWKLLRILSAIRKFNPNMLKQLKDYGVISGFESEYDLESQLLRTSFVKRENGFLQDKFTRRLLVIDLHKDKELFNKICHAAIKCYEALLKKPTSYRPDILAAELLFQKLHYFIYKEQNGQRGGKEEFFKNIPEAILNELVAEREDQTILINSFKGNIHQDIELRFLLNYLLCDEKDGYDDTLFEKLIEKVTMFEKFFANKES